MPVSENPGEGVHWSSLGQGPGPGPVSCEEEPGWPYANMATSPQMLLLQGVREGEVTREKGSEL